MLTEKRRIESKQDRDIWTRALEFAIKGLHGFLAQHENLLQNDRVGIHAKHMIEEAQRVYEEEKGKRGKVSLDVIQKYEWYLQKLHRTLRGRVEKLQKGEDPDATFGRAVLRAIQQMLSNNTTAHAFFERSLYQHNQKTRSEKNQ